MTRFTHPLISKCIFVIYDATIYAYHDSAELKVDRLWKFKYYISYLKHLNVTTDRDNQIQTKHVVWLYEKRKKNGFNN